MPSVARHRRSLLVPALAVAGIAAAAMRMPGPAARTFVLEPAEAAAPARARPVPEAIDLAAGAASAHASSMASLPDGHLLVAWFAGSREGASDVAIRMALLRDGRVESEWESLDRLQLQSMVHRSVRKLGNPVLWVAPDGELHMFVVSVSVGGWSGSAVNHLRSADGGRSWLSARRLVLSPFLDLGTLVRTPPVARPDGSLVLPAYHEFIRKHGMAVELSPEGTVRGVARIPGPGALLQPAVAATSEGTALALLRSGDRSAPRIFASASSDGGRTWQDAQPTELANPDSAVALLRLRDGRLLLAANPVSGGRHELALFLGDPALPEWRRVRTVERGDAATDEFSYPALCQQPDGTVWLSYTEHRRGIRLRAYDPAALVPHSSEPVP